MSRLTFAVIMVVTSTTASSSNDMTGQASIIDGDTLEIHGPAFGSGASMRPRAISFVEERIACNIVAGRRRRTSLTPSSPSARLAAPRTLDQYGGTVATRSIGGVDLGEWFVRNGLALDWPTYSRGNTTRSQRDAEHTGRGMWWAATLSHGCSACDQAGREAGRMFGRCERTPLRRDRRGDQWIIRDCALCSSFTASSPQPQDWFSPSRQA